MFRTHATSDMHSLINSPSENGLLFFASLYKTIKLTSFASSCMIDCLVKTFSCFFSLFTSSLHFRFLSSLVKFCPKFACLVWLCLFKLYSLKTATDSPHNKPLWTIKTKLRKNMLNKTYNFLRRFESTYWINNETYKKDYC